MRGHQNYKQIKWLFLIIFILLNYNSRADNVVKLVSSQVVWDKGAHNAFTTIESFQEYLYCAFREGSSHKSYDGKIRIIRSLDGKKWESVSLLSSSGEDLRDPKFVKLGNRLVLLIVSRTKQKHFSYTYHSKNGVYWEINDKTKDTWRWSATKLGENIFSVGYSGKDKGGTLYLSTDGKSWSSLKTHLFQSEINLPNETKLFFDTHQKMIALVRQERNKMTAMLGTSNPPYNVWEWKALDRRIGSPAGIMLDNSTILACVRLYTPRIETAFVLIDLNTGKITKDLRLPSGGDTGYADITRHNNKVYVSYYSSINMKKTSIYIAEISIHE